jgi:hypothetical protein
MATVAADSLLLAPFLDGAWGGGRLELMILELELEEATSRTDTDLHNSTSTNRRKGLVTAQAQS